jgi:hypothetical protein
MIKKIIFILLGGIMTLTGMSGEGFAAGDSCLKEPAAVFEGGSLYRCGKLPVLDLCGNFKQMGRQYGHLLSAELQDLYQRAVVDYFMEKKGLDAALIDQTANALFEFYPRRFKDIVLGMAETSGLSEKEQIRLNAIELYGTISGCSGIFAWGDYTGGGPLVCGRNYDWFDSYSDFAKSLVVTVFHPDSGISSAIVTFAGVIYMTTGLNEQGIFLELNNGMPSGGALSHSNRVAAIASLMGFLMDYGTLPQIDAAFNSTRPEFAYIINAADCRQAFSYEWPPFDLRRRSGDDEGLLVATNHFADPSWGLVLQEAVGFESVLRRRNLLTLGKRDKGKIDTLAVMKMLDTSTDEGGATWPETGEIRTVYQVVAVPRDRMLIIKVPGYQEWTYVDLKKLF